MCRNCPVPTRIVASVGESRPSSRQQRSKAQRTSAGHRGTVDVRLKDPAGEQFSGVATIHLFTIAGSEAPGSAENSGEQIHFADISPGSYIVEVTAPGFASVRQPLEISAERLSTSVFLTMTPETIRDQGGFRLGLRSDFDREHTRGRGKIAPSATASRFRPACYGRRHVSSAPRVKWSGPARGRTR